MAASGRNPSPRRERDSSFTFRSPNRERRDASPEDLPVLSPPPPTATCGLAPAVADALAALPASARGRLTLLVNDPQRHTDTRTVLTGLAAQTDLSTARVLIATGTHRFDSGTRRAFERDLLAGLDVTEVAWHDARSPALVRVGGQWRGHPWLSETEPLLAIGSVEPHYFAGFTGAHKTCTIGCASWEDIEANHTGALEATARPTALEGNPVHGGVVDMLGALATRTSVAVVNLVQAGGQILAAAGGEPLDALARVLPAARRAFVLSIPAPADAIIAEVAGPLGASFYQADKGIKNTEWAVRDGGCLVLLAPCGEGVGQDHFLALLREAATHQEALDVVGRRGYRLGDHKAVKLRYTTDPACRGLSVFAVSPGLPDADATILGLQKADTVTAALAAAGVDPRAGRVWRVGDAGNTVVRVRAD